MARNEYVRSVVDQYKRGIISSALLDACLQRLNPHPEDSMAHQFFREGLTEIIMDQHDEGSLQVSYRLIDWFEDDDHE